MQLGTELGRQADLANNNANFAKVQQDSNSTNLLAALNYALTGLGTTGASTSNGTGSGSGFNWGVGVQGGFAQAPSGTAFGFGA